jgi:hypothetical protein
MTNLDPATGARATDARRGRRRHAAVGRGPATSGRAWAWLRLGSFNVVLGLLLACTPGALEAQEDSTRWEAWPEVDVWVQLDPRWKLFFPFALSRGREVDYLEALVGAHVDYRFNRHLSARIGYRYLWAVSEAGEPDQYQEHRPVAEVTVRAYPGLGITLLDRNRFDLRIINGETSWRYRNRFRAERPFPFAADRSLMPYAMIEAGYDSRYDEFNRLRLQTGAEFQFSGRVVLDTYYVGQIDDRSSVPRLNAIGLALNLFY